MKYIKIAQEMSSNIQQCVDENPKMSNTKLAQVLKNKFNLENNVNYLRQVIGTWKNLNEHQKTVTPTKSKVGFETRDGYVINWSDNTIVTDLGVYGTYVCSVDRHRLIQREYVYDGSNETGAIVAMKFDFPHTKAIYQYAKIHGFSKASTPQTDIEFELGLTVEQAVEENLQSIKRNVYKKTQKRKWKETVDAADKWWTIEDTLLEQIQVLTISLQERKIDQLEIIVPQTDYKFAAFIGMTDVHYMKLCYDYKGEITYDRNIAIERMREHTVSLAQEVSRYGRPEKFYVMVGCDNIHVDGIHHGTTKFTSQHQATDGMWRLEMKNYFQLIIDQIEYYKQIAPVTALPVKGNHDFQTSIALQAMLEIYYKDDALVDVVVCHDARVYHQYGKVCVIPTHGDELGSVKNLESKAHQLIMGEAKDQGIDVMEVEYYILFHGHEHVGSTRDLNGRVQRIGLPSMSGIDDWWHKEKGYVGRQFESLVTIIDPIKGRKALLYA